MPITTDNPRRRSAASPSFVLGALSVDRPLPATLARNEPERSSDEEIEALVASLPLALREKANQHMRALIARGELVDAARFITARGFTRQALSKALADRRVFFVELDSERYVPSFFFDPRYERQQVEAVCKALGPLPGGAKLQFFETPQLPLGGLSPLQALQKGRLDEVLVTAHAFLDM